MLQNPISSEDVLHLNNLRVHFPVPASNCSHYHYLVVGVVPNGELVRRELDMSNNFEAYPIGNYCGGRSFY